MKSVDGTLGAFVGPPGCGKTYAAVAVGLSVARESGIPFLAIDPAGEVQKYIDGYIAYADEHGDADTVAWLRDPESVRCLRIRSEDSDDSDAFTMDEALKLIRDFIADCLRRKVTTPQAVVFLDELSHIREASPGFQNVTIPLGRNAGMYFVGTCQTMVGMTPKARTCSRYVVGWKTVEGGATILGRWLDNGLLSSPQSDSLSCVTPWSAEVIHFDLSGTLPEVVRLPVVPTQLIKRRL